MPMLATGSELVAGIRPENLMQQVKSERVKATRGFYVNVNGQFSLVNPGDVVEVGIHDARMLVAASKAEPSSANLFRESNYLPERKKNPKPDTATQLESLTRAVEGLTTLVQQLVTKPEKAK